MMKRADCVESVRKMPREISCGAIIFRDGEDGRKYLVLHYGSGHWDFVKGNIEKGESEKETTIREINEETGINDVNFFDDFKHKVNWFYKRDGKIIYKEVTYFLIKTTQKEVKLSSEHTGYKWLGYEEALKQITFRNSRKLLEKAEGFVKNRD
jgi:8-oxo-dGTP pyrophosphatase MutT (NUDIX family)